MKAAVVSAFDAPPSYAEYAVPTAHSADEVVIDVVAAGLHPRVRSQANGSHYTSTDQLPLVPGIDGVGRMPDGSLRYFILPDTTMGSMAERTLIDVRRSVPLAAGTDAIQVAAAMNPTMSSWLALRRRIAFRAGQSVLVLGATGNAGRMAVQVARYFGAATVVAAGRRPDRLAELAELGASTVVSLDGEPDQVAEHLGTAAGEVDVVIDYLWGAPAAAAMRALLTHRSDDEDPLSWVQIGSVAGPEAPILSAALRAFPLQIVGSGQGSVSTRAILTELPELAAQISAGTFRVDARAVPLADIEPAWADTASDQRIVITP